MARILQQDPHKPSDALVSDITTLLRDPELIEFRAIVSYVKWSGLGFISKPLQAFLKRRGRVHTIFGVNNGVTTADALLYAQWLMRMYPQQTQSYVFEWCYQNSTFHPKFYYFLLKNRVAAIIGSSNLTCGGVLTNYELNVLLESAPGSAADNELKAYWNSLCSPSAEAITAETIRRLTKDGELADEEPIQLLPHGDRPKFRVPWPDWQPKPLFRHILEYSSKSVKRDVLAEADTLSEKPRKFYLQILRETGGGNQVQLPKATLGAFFGIGPGESRAVRFRFPEEEVDVHLTHFQNDTHRIRLRPLRSVKRPAIVVFQRITNNEYECTVVPPERYAQVLQNKCTEQTYATSRKWGFE